MLNRVWRLGSGIRLSPNERLVLLALADRCNGAGICWPGLTDLAARSGLRPRAIRAILRRLERRKLVVTHHRRGRTSRYHLLLSDAASKVSTPARGYRGVGQPSGVNTPAWPCPHPGTVVPPNPQEPSDYTHGEGIETYGSGRSGAGGGRRKIAAHRRWFHDARGAKGRS